MKIPIYSKALKNIYGYMGIENIIRRLQDVDKLKIVLFDKSQRKMFEQLPKPGIAKKQSIFSEEFHFMVESDSPKSDQNEQNLEHFKQQNFHQENDDPLNKRLFEIMESRKTFCKNLQKRKKIYFFSIFLYF